MERSKASVLRGGKNDAVAVGQTEVPAVPHFNLYRDYFKRLLDLVISVAALPLVLPTFCILYLHVRRDGGPFLYKHERIGRGGEIFECMKIRSMVVDSQAVLKSLMEENPEAREEWNSNFKLQDDPRVTKIGKILRKTSLDELPQLLNVLKGDMSLVGPRPITAEELLRYGESAEIYEQVRPGLTGPWQVTGRRENDFESRAVLDSNYVKNVGFFSDVYYLLATVPEMLFFRGR